MSLGIENATLGYDHSGVQSYINDINTQVVTSTCNSMRRGMSNLRTAVDAVWVGSSAEQFKTNMEHDMDRVIAAIEAAREQLIGELKDITSKMGELDENLVKPR